MIDWTRMGPPSSAAALVRLGGELGIAADDLLQDSGLTASMLTSLETQVSGIQDVHLVRNLHRMVPRHDHLGVLVGRRFHSTTYGTVGFAMSCASDLNEVDRIFGTFQELAFVMTGVSGSLLDRRFDATDLPSDVRDFYSQRDSAATMNLFHELLDPTFTPERATFAQPAPDSAAGRQAFAEAYGPHLSFDAEHTALQLPAASLTLPLRRSTPTQMPLLLDQCRLQLEQHRTQTQVSSQVTRTITDLLDQGATIDMVARALLVSPRTLRRQLAAEGTTYRDLLESVRAREATDLLVRPALTVAQVASRLGYENPPAFTTAFRRWYGVTPTEFRLAAS